MTVADAVESAWNRARALRDRGELPAAARAFRDIARADPSNFEAMQQVVHTVARIAAAPGDASAPSNAAVHAPDTPVSIVVCSVDRARAEAMRANYTAALGDRPHELIVIGDARSLAEAYNGALARCRHGVVVFSHDDIELLSPRPFDRLLEALEHHDVVGLVGSRSVSGPAVLWAGHPHLRGGIAYPSSSGFTATVFSLATGVIGGMQALDGMLFAARREVAAAVGFDERTFDGFHFYDLDFTHRVHRAGYRVAVTTRLAAVHASSGAFDASWKGYATRFRAKFPDLQAPAGAHHAYHAALPTRESVVRFYAELEALDRDP